MEDQLRPEVDTESGEPIAIIGMAGRFPGAADTRAFWENLAAGVESITFFSDEALREAGIPDDVLTKPNYVKARAVLDNIDRFDADFFSVPPREAQITDPQHRFFLELAWAALEDAGYDPAEVNAPIGLFGGCAFSDYLRLIYTDPRIRELVGDYQILLANDKDHLTTRVSYKLDLKGPAVSVQTACSTSLAATYLACQSLIGYQCDMALAGGVAIDTDQKSGYFFQQGGIRSPDGHCRAFDKKANGCIGGNGAAIVVLKRLEDALADRDHIVAVIRGAAMNNDGADKVGYTAPSIRGQAEVIAAALETAEVDPATNDYVEAHGTGTPLGDLIELSALNKAYQSFTDKRDFCGVGSVKTNLGHLDTAAGVTGLIKAALALENELIPASLHCKEPSPRLDFETSPFFVQQEARAWPRGEMPRRAGVSSFGIGGTNIHMILEEAPRVGSPVAGREIRLLPISAKSPTALDQAIRRLSAHLTAQTALPLGDVAYTLQVGRRHFGHRALCLVGRDEAAAELLDPETLPRGTVDEAPPVVFLFPGQGAQYAGMARGLYREERVFREALDACFAGLREVLGVAPERVLFPEGEITDEHEVALEDTTMAQPLLFSVEYALARLLMSWGVEPSGMLGHSLGEYVAATLAGVFSLEDGLALVAERGRLMGEMPTGDMMAVSLPEDEVTGYLDEAVAIAAVNAPGTCVVSGPADAIAALRGRLEESKVPHRMLHTSHAFHSAMMEGVVAPFEAKLRGMDLSPPQRPFISGVSGTWITEAEATDPNYWARHVRMPVRFGTGVQTLLAESDRVFVEVGPGNTLASLVRLVSGGADQAIPTMRHPKADGTDGRVLAAALGRLWLAGATIDWQAYNGDHAHRRCSLPSYPFEGKRFWIDAAGLDPVTPSESADAPRTWRRTAGLSPPAEVEPGTWMIMTDTVGFGFRLDHRLRQHEQTVVTVKAGASYDHPLDNVFVIDPADPATYGQMTADMAELELEPSRLIYMWSFDPKGDRPRSEPETLDALIDWARTWEGGEITDVLIVTSIEESGDPEQTTSLLDACRATDRVGAPRVHWVEIGFEGEMVVLEEWMVDQLLLEPLQPTAMDAVSYRGNHRWVLGSGDVIDAAEAPSAADHRFERPALANAYVAPRNDLETDLTGILENRLGIAGVGVHDDFFDLGGTSLTAVEVMARVSEVVGRALEPGLLLENNTVARLAEKIEGDRETSIADIKTSPIVPIQALGEKTPIFLAHPAGGNVFGYRDLANRLGLDQPLYGLSAFELDEVSTHRLRIEDLASHYVRALREFQREGPYHIGGWSFGGFVAFEMARQLSAAGDQVGMLVMLDTPAPDPVVGELGNIDEIRLLTLLAREWAARQKNVLGLQKARSLVTADKIRDLPREEQLEHMLDLLKKKQVIDPGRDMGWINRFIDGYRSRIGALSHYRVDEPYPGPLLLFRAASIDPEQVKIAPPKLLEMIEDPLFGWGAFVAGKVTAHTIPGYHESIVIGSNAKLVARHMHAYLDKEMGPT